MTTSRGSPSRRLPAGTHAARCSPVTRSSRSRTHVSRQGDGWRQIRSQTTERRLSRGMIGAMPDLSERLLTDRSFDTPSYTSAYRSAYPVVYTKAKEVW